MKHPWPQPPRLLQQARQPLQAQALKDGMRAFDPPAVEIEHRSDRRRELDVQFRLMPMQPLFLFRRSHANPQHIRRGGIDRGDHRPVIVGGEFRLEGRRVAASHLEIGIIPHQALADRRQRFLGRSQENTRPPPPAFKATSTSRKMSLPVTRSRIRPPSVEG